MNLCNMREIKLLLQRHGFHFSKSMGQNFLVADWVPCKIAEAAGIEENCGVLEIGPGIGPLTRQLAIRSDKVVAIELDQALLPVLAETLSEFTNVEIISGDAMKMDLSALVADQLRGLQPLVCANLPYNITTPILTKLLEANCFSSITVMIQREVARRICAAPGSSDYGSFSVFCQYYADCEILFDVGPECFLPAPKVTSSVLRMRPLQTPPVEVQDPDAFFSLVHAAFAQRRKTLLNGLCSAYGNHFSKEELRSILSANGLPENIRGERLSLAQFANLAKCLK